MSMKTMMISGTQLYDVSVADALEYSISVVMENNRELTKKEAKALVLNAIMYNCVVNEIAGQVEFLLGKLEF